MAEIEVISSCLVGTTRDISMSKVELNKWDISVFHLVYTQRGFIFHNPKPDQLQQPLINHLKNSLSRTLDFFPPLAGRLAATGHDGDMSSFSIDCNNAGALFSHAVAAAVSVSDVLEDKCPPEFISSLFPFNGVYSYDGVSTPLLGVQITELAGGVFIGCATNHGVMDGASLWHFINSWSEISRGCDTISKLPTFERWFPTTAADDYMNRLVHLPTLKKISSHPLSLTPQKIFHFSKESLAALKAKANSEVGTHKISTLQAVIALLWRSSARSAIFWNSSAGYDPFIVMSIGARARLSLPDGYFGNAFYVAPITMSESDLLQRGLGHVALRINEFVAQQTREAIISKWAEGIVTSGPRPLIIGSSPRYDVYGNDFGWGKPIALRSGISNKPEGMVRATAAADAGGMDLEVYLAGDMLKALECDAEFMGAISTR